MKKIHLYRFTQDITGESYLESIFMDVIRMYHLPFPRREYPVGRYSIDFAYPIVKLGIELDGNQHFTKKGQLHDKQKDEFLGSHGWKILRADRNTFHTPAFVRLIRKTINQRLRRFKNETR